MPETERAAGLLLHPTSLPGLHGIGDIGAGAHRFVDFLSAAGCRLWQMLPLGPPVCADSPYAACSTRAGNPLLVSLEALAAEGWADPGQLPPVPDFPEGRVDFDLVESWKIPALRTVYERFERRNEDEPQTWFEEFCAAHAAWLEDYALFIALKAESGGESWTQWEGGLATRDQKALENARARLADEVRFRKFVQFLFDRQWEGLRNHCRERGVRLVGDVPIFVALDSVDVWAHQELFHLEADGTPTVVAGVPPDYFSPTGQFWGNPLYDWKKHKAQGYAWWMDRLEAVLRRVDVVRVDHFRGFEAFWQIPAEAETAREGEWVKGPGADFLEAVEEHFGELPFIAEDLGTITPEVHALRERFNLPGMRVLQFAFGDEDPREAGYLPHNHTPDSVIYTGTHDNDTTVGWFRGTDTEADRRTAEQRQNERRRFLEYAAPGVDPGDPLAAEAIHWRMIALALLSVGAWAIAPVQDVLGLGGEARMNRPGLLRADNWSWRLTPEQFETLCGEAIRDRLRTLVWRYGRL
jgi:4-alpha-glucanotransferase